jgi:hypothetical protein
MRRFNKIHTKQINVAVTLKACIPEVLDSNFDRDIRYPKRDI